MSMFVGFIAWYRGLAIGPMTAVSQTQLLQPVLTMIWSALLLGETITPLVALSGARIILLAWAAVHTRSRTRS
ncbi:EamA-like transporter family [Acidipropionibacterium jensenii]|uniref:EamA-like transporter family n=2 Tax=Acidipropionibacterium jensenii TaxID=1749 RepID=A0A448NVG5_9ACTN|nr:EamA-like transporter family [Acidipropionibacterium jensenii]